VARLPVKVPWRSYSLESARARYAPILVAFFPIDRTAGLLQDKKSIDLLNSISLNKIRVVVDAIFAMDVDTVPSRVDSVTFDQTSSDDWKAKKTSPA
jgi:hypothetical protein